MRELISNTSIIENRIRRNLEAKYGLILDEAAIKSIVAKELNMAKKQQKSLDKARLTLLRTKDIARLRQQVRKTRKKVVEDCPPNEKSSGQKPQQKRTEPNYLVVNY